jgi:hypothetical protein
MKDRYVSTSLKLAILGAGFFGQSILTDEMPAQTGRYRVVWHKNRGAKQKTNQGHATNLPSQASN